MVEGKRQYRSRIEIAASIIEIAKNGARKTRIMYLGNLSFDLLQKYLEMLTGFGLIQSREGSAPTYVATEKGYRFLEDFKELRKYSDLAANKKRSLERSLTPASARGDLSRNVSGMDVRQLGRINPAISGTLPS